MLSFSLRFLVKFSIIHDKYHYYFTSKLIYSDQSWISIFTDFSLKGDFLCKSGLKKVNYNICKVEKPQSEDFCLLIVALLIGLKILSWLILIFYHTNSQGCCLSAITLKEFVT
jgi:hypothetical protein